MSMRRGDDVGRRDPGPGPGGPPPSRGANLVRRLALAVYAIVFIAAGWFVWHQVFRSGGGHGTAAPYAAGGGSNSGAFRLQTAGSPSQTGTPTAAEAKRFANTAAPEFAAAPTWLQDFTTQPDGPVTGWRIDLGLGINGWYNQEVASYTDDPSNLRVQGGQLVIQAHRAPATSEVAYTSGRVSTRGIRAFKYGKFDVVAKLPDGVGTWPAIWLISNAGKYRSETPPSDPIRYLNDGEIDMVETVFPGQIYSVAQARLSVSGLPNEHYVKIPVPDDARVFHDYGLEWTPTRLTFLLDGRPYYRLDKQPGWDWRLWPYDQTYYLVINLAMGGAWGDYAKSKYPPYGVDNAQLPQSLRVKSVAYYPYLGPAGG
jgi:beta-glucanase (GH16 family)